MTLLEVPGCPHLSQLSSLLYRQLCAFGALATDVRGSDPWARYGSHARMIAEWFDFQEVQGPLRFRGAEPFALHPDRVVGSTPFAGRTDVPGLGVADLAYYRIDRWQERFGDAAVTAVTDQATLVRGALYQARAVGVSPALSWLCDVVDAGWVAQWQDLAACLSALSLLTEERRLALPELSDLDGWRLLRMEEIPVHLDRSVESAMVTHNVSVDVPFGADEQRRLLDLATRVIERTRQSASLDEWTLGRLASQTWLAAVLRQFPHDRRGMGLAMRSVLNAFDEIVADLNPAMTAGTDVPDFVETWDYARNVVAVLAPDLGAEAANRVVEERLLVPRAVATQVLEDSDLPMGWQFISPALALPWGAIHEWDPRRAHLDDYVAPLSMYRDLAIASAEERREINDMMVPALARQMLLSIVSGKWQDMDFGLGLAIAEHPYSDEYISVGAYLALSRGKGDDACALGILAVLAQPAEQARWLDLSRQLKFAGYVHEGSCVALFHELRD